ncbi:uncharacterized protein LOC122960469 [Acropora millepora]|uniref:uncharacterized protein LOC122960469 n=1 Tax=Acropora millepora TaxID=45264 RepID=UPI001CF53809|nr:uncharacterized protein LOC122960469 [Acropora millepora]
MAQALKVLGETRAIVRNLFHKAAEYQDILPSLTLEKGANRGSLLFLLGEHLETLSLWAFVGVLGDTFAEETGVADIVKFFCSEVVVSCSREIRGSDVYFQRQEVAFRVTDADVVRACTIGNRAVASRGSSRLSPRRKSKEPPLSRRVVAYIHMNAKEIPARHQNARILQATPHHSCQQL